MCGKGGIILLKQPVLSSAGAEGSTWVNVADCTKRNGTRRLKADSNCNISPKHEPSKNVSSPYKLMREDFALLYWHNKLDWPRDADVLEIEQLQSKLTEEAVITAKRKMKRKRRARHARQAFVPPSSWLPSSKRRCARRRARSRCWSSSWGTARQTSATSWARSSASRLRWRRTRRGRSCWRSRAGSTPTSCTPAPSRPRSVRSANPHGATRRTKALKWWFVGNRPTHAGQKDGRFYLLALRADRGLRDVLSV